MPTCADSKLERKAIHAISGQLAVPTRRGIEMQTAPKPNANGHAHDRNGHTPTNRFADNLPPLEPVSDGSAVEQKPPAAKDAKEPGGRNDKGQFTAGNRFGRGNPFTRKLGAMRSAFLDAVTPADIQKLAAALLKMAIAGNLDAARLLLAYGIGKAGAAVNPDEADLHEFALLARRPDKDELREVLFKRNPGLAAELAPGIGPQSLEAMREEVLQTLEGKMKRMKERMLERWGEGAGDIDDLDDLLGEEEADNTGSINLALLPSIEGPA
jgi:hypothetical protein